ncbi:MAG: hypothetical protein KAS53_12850 [Candidatus Cloacimonetes bacterium]|nr:hypothetical protein [Candidatus Cloacimonadota bacterium]
MKTIFFVLVISIFSTFLLADWIDQDPGISTLLRDTYFVDSENGWVVGTTNTILHTTNGGEDWTQQIVAPSSNYASIFFIDSQEGWAVGDLGKIVHTTDTGENGKRYLPMYTNIWKKSSLLIPKMVGLLVVMY